MDHCDPHPGTQQCVGPGPVPQSGIEIGESFLELDGEEVLGGERARRRQLERDQQRRRRT